MNGSLNTLILAIIICLAGLILLWLARRKQKASGLPAGRVIYSDTRHWGKVEQALYDQGLKITGRPDYLIKNKNVLIPVEVKSSHVNDAPYDSHIYQLAAYCYLIETAYNKRPTHGIIHYPNRTYAIDYTQELEQSFIEVIENMRILDNRKDVNRSHDSAQRCQGCGYRSICDRKLI